MDMICLMHEGTPYGHLKVGGKVNPKVDGKVIHPPNLARILGSTLPETEGWLAELDGAGVFSRADDGCIYSRRMVRDEEIREKRSAGGSLGGNPSLKTGEKVNPKVDGKVGVKVNPKVKEKDNLFPTPASASASSSSSANSLTPDEGFALFWSKYPRKTAKDKAEASWKRLNPSPELEDQIISDVLKRKTSPDWCKDGGQYIPHPTTYLNQKRWEEVIEVSKPIQTYSDGTPQKDWKDMTDDEILRAVI